MNNNMPVINISKNIKDNPLEVWVKIILNMKLVI